MAGKITEKNVAIVENVPEIVLNKSSQVSGYKEDLVFYIRSVPAAATITGTTYLLHQIPENNRLLSAKEKTAWLEHLQDLASNFYQRALDEKKTKESKELYRVSCVYRELVARLLDFDMPLSRQVGILHYLYDCTALAFEDIAAILNVKSRNAAVEILRRAGVRFRPYQKRQAAAKFHEKILQVSPPPPPPPRLFDPRTEPAETEEILTEFLEFLCEESEELQAWRDELARSLEVDRYTVGAFIDGLVEIAHHPTTGDVVRAYIARAQRSP